MNTVLNALIVFLPAGVANMTPVLANKVPLLNQWETPVDFGKSWRGARIFGDHKTWRGIVTGTTCGTLVGLAIAATFLANDHSEPWFLYFLALSFGALFGDAIKSFFKRRSHVKPGKSWFPFDQLDYIVGGLVFTLPFGIPKLSFVLSVIGIYFVLHVTVSYIGYLTGFKDEPI